MIRKFAAASLLGFAAVGVAAVPAHADDADKVYEWPIDYSGESYAIRPGSWLLEPLPRSSECLYAFEPYADAPSDQWWGGGRITGPTWIKMPANAYLISDCYPFDNANNRPARPSTGS
ncbi:hypothetical protein, partial [Nocardia seriolae]